MTHVVEWLSTSTTLIADGGYLSMTWDSLVQAFVEKRFYDVMLNHFVIGLSVALLLLGIFTKSKKLIMMLIAFWGYSLVWHFTIEGHEVSTESGKNVAMGLQVQGLGPVVLFFLGFIGVTGLLLYFGFIKGD